MNKQFCSECGKQLPLHSKFCTDCGHPVVASSSEQQEPTQSFVNNPPKKNNKTGFLIGAAVIIGIIALFMINSKDSPEKVAENFVTYMSDFQFDKVKGLLAEDADDYLKEEIDWMIETLRDDPILFDEQENYGYKVKNFRVTDIDEGSIYTYVFGTITYVNGETEDIDIDLLKEDGKWKVEDSY